MAKSLTQAFQDWRAARQRIEKVNADLPRIMGIVAVKSIKQNFMLQGYDSGLGVNKWPPRSEATNKSYTYGRGKGGKSNYKGSVFNAANPILIQTHNLMNSIKYKEMVKGVIVGVLDTTVVPYAQIHNEGGMGVMYGHTFTMPKRQFMPLPSEGPKNVKIVKALLKKIKFEYENALKPVK